MILKNILCYGDSNTWGWTPVTGARYPLDVRWTGILQKNLGAGYHVIEDGMSGRTTCYDDPTWPDHNGFKSIYASLETHFPLDLVIIMLGSNDAKRHICATPYASACGMENIVRVIRSGVYGNGKKDPEILIVSPILIGEEIDRTCSFGEHSAPFSQLFAQEFGRVAREQGTFFLDAAKYAGPSREDNLHMTPEGHAALAEAMTEKVLEILG